MFWVETQNVLCHGLTDMVYCAIGWRKRCTVSCVRGQGVYYAWVGGQSVYCVPVGG